MRIIDKAVFWHGPNDTQQFHADMTQEPGESVPAMVERFRDMFPCDTVTSVRDTSGRFIPFKPSKREAAAMASEYKRFRYSN
jgi:hypothetical protein